MEGRRYDAVWHLRSGNAACADPCRGRGWHLAASDPALAHPTGLSSGPTRRLAQYCRATRAWEPEAESTARVAVDKGVKFSRWRQSDKDVLDSLEFDEQDEHFFHALSNPQDDGDMLTVGSDGKTVDSAYLFRRWIDGKDAGLFQERVALQSWLDGEGGEEGNEFVRSLDDNKATRAEARDAASVADMYCSL